MDPSSPVRSENGNSNPILFLFSCCVDFCGCSSLLSELTWKYSKGQDNEDQVNLNVMNWECLALLLSVEQLTAKLVCPPLFKILSTFTCILAIHYVACI